MSTDVTRASANGRTLSTPSRTTRAPVVLPTREKRPGYVALAIVLIVGLAALGAFFYSKAGQKTPVVVVVRDVPAGHRIERSDLSTVDVAGAVTAVGGSHLDAVLGQTATVELLPNTLLQRSMLTAAGPLGPGLSMVGVELKPGQLPANGLSDGARVQVLQLPDKTTGSLPTAGSAGSAPVVLAAMATVYASTQDPSQTGGTLLTLIVPSSDAAAIAAASSAGVVALVQVGS